MASLTTDAPSLAVDTDKSAMPDIGTYRYEFYGHPFGVQTVEADGTMAWGILDRDINALFARSRHAEMPATAYNMHPDHGQFGRLLNIKDKNQYFGGGIKALSGIRIFKVNMNGTASLSSVFDARGKNLDIRTDTLSDRETTDHNRVFIGNYVGPVGLAGTKEFNDIIRNQWVDRFDHRFSGKENKMPCTQRGNIITPAVNNLPFTTFVKFPAVGGRESNGLLEWAGMRMAEDAGLKTAKYALIDQGPDLPPAVAIERFDIPRKTSDLDREWILMQDFYAITGNDPMKDVKKKGVNNMFRYNELIHGLIEHNQKHDPRSTQRNVRALLKRILVAWAGNDADLHAKNLSVIHKIDPATKKIKSVEMSPVYDSVPSTMRGSDGEPMFYSLRKTKGMICNDMVQINLGMNDWLHMLSDPKISLGGRPYCIFKTKEDAEEFIREVVSDVAYSLVRSLQNMPEFVYTNKNSAMLAVDMQQTAFTSVKRAKSIGAKTPDFDFDPDLMKIANKYGAKARKSLLDKECDSVVTLYNKMTGALQELGARFAPVRTTVPIHGGGFAARQPAAVLKPDR